MKKQLKQVRKEQQRLSKSRSPEYQAKLKLVDINNYLNNRKSNVKQPEETFLTDQLDDPSLHHQLESIMEKSLTRDPTLLDVRPSQIETEAQEGQPDTTMDDQHSLFSGSQQPEKKAVEYMETSMT